MAHSLSFDQLTEVIRLTLDKLNKPSYTDISHDLQDWPFAKRILKAKAKKVDGGKGDSWTVKVNRGPGGEHAGAFQKDQFAIVDMTKKARVPMRYTRGNYVFDLTEEELNSGPEQIVDVVKMRRADCQAEMIELVDAAALSGPVSSDDETTPWGITHTVRKHPDTDTAAGWNGGNPTGFSDTQGINGDTYTNFSPYTDYYENITPGDLITKAKMAFDKTRFRAPVPHPTMSPDDPKWGIYSNYSMRQGLNEVFDQINDNLSVAKGEISMSSGTPLFRGIPVEWVPNLDSDTSDPFYMLNWNVLYPIIRSGWNMRETGPKENHTLGHTVRVVYLDFMWNMVNRDPRKCACLNKIV